MDDHDLFSIADVYCQLPWHCGDRDCPVGWHLGTYWLQSDGNFSYDAYGDGDHETITPEEAPKGLEPEQAWNRYYQDVIDTGEDPLGQLAVNYHHRRTEQRWQVRFNDSILGPVLIGCRRNARGPWQKTPPPELAEYLGVVRNNSGTRWTVNTEWYDHEEYRGYLNHGAAGYTRQRRTAASRWLGLVTIEAHTPRSKAAVRRDLIRAARKELTT